MFWNLRTRAQQVKFNNEQVGSQQGCIALLSCNNNGQQGRLVQAHRRWPKTEKDASARGFDFFAEV